MKNSPKKSKGWLPFAVTFVLLLTATLVLVLLSMGPQLGPFLYQIQ